MNFTDIAAELTSPNSIPVTVVFNETVETVFRFLVNGEDIIFGDGTLRIRFEVEEGTGGTGGATGGGGAGGVGEVNQCPEYRQIIVTPTTTSTGGDPVNVQIWCYDPDGDDAEAAVLFITAASFVDPNPANWIACGSNPAHQFPPFPVPCPHMDPPPVPGNQSTDLQLFCNIGDDPAPGDPGTECVVIVSISDDGFASGGTDPFGCDGTDDNAQAVIPVFCQNGD
jgi:hypothetical protein